MPSLFGIHLLACFTKTTHGHSRTSLGRFYIPNIQVPTTTSSTLLANGARLHHGERTASPQPCGIGLRTRQTRKVRFSTCACSIVAALTKHIVDCAKMTPHPTSPLHAVSVRGESTKQFYSCTPMCSEQHATKIGRYRFEHALYDIDYLMLIGSSGM